MPDELLQCFDEQENPTEVQPRREVKKNPPRWWYGVVRIFVVNKAGEILLSKRAETVASNPGKWQAFFGGHVGAGEDFLSVAQRELEEEAGISVPKDELHFVTEGKKSEKRVHYKNYAVFFDGDISKLQTQQSEIAEIKWSSIPNFLKQFGTFSEKFHFTDQKQDAIGLQGWLTRYDDARNMQRSASIKYFEDIRDIPYAIPLGMSETDDCCSGKHRRLKTQLEARGLKTDWQVCSFKWSQLKLPKKVLALPHADDSTHVFLRVLIESNWVDVDATWDAAVMRVLPVNKWDGKTSTGIAVPAIEFFSLEESRKIMDEENPQETSQDIATNGKFYRAFNEWLDEVRREGNTAPQ